VKPRRVATSQKFPILIQKIDVERVGGSRSVVTVPRSGRRDRARPSNLGNFWPPVCPCPDFASRIWPLIWGMLPKQFMAVFWCSGASVKRRFPYESSDSALHRSVATTRNRIWATRRLDATARCPAPGIAEPDAHGERAVAGDDVFLLFPVAMRGNRLPTREVNPFFAVFLFEREVHQHRAVTSKRAESPIGHVPLRLRWQRPVVFLETPLRASDGGVDFGVFHAGKRSKAVVNGQSRLRRPR